MKAPSLTYQSKALANVQFFSDKQTDRRTDGQTDKLPTISLRSIDAEA